jgi:hypothetical protein
MFFFLVNELFFAGLVHSGFNQYASDLDVSRFCMDFSDHSKDKIIFCGHSLGRCLILLLASCFHFIVPFSLGGAVAHLACLKALCTGEVQGNSSNIRSVAFGAPFFGDKAVAEWITKQGYGNKLITIIHPDDMVPAILNVAEVPGLLFVVILSFYFLFPFLQSASMFSDVSKSMLKTVANGVLPKEVVDTVVSLPSGLFDAVSWLINKFSPTYYPAGQYVWITQKKLTLLTDPEVINNCLKGTLTNIKFDSFRASISKYGSFLFRRFVFNVF